MGRRLSGFQGSHPRLSCYACPLFCFVCLRFALTLLPFTIRYIPQAGSKAKLRPVLMSIYGGGFTGGNSGPFSGLDTGNLASREDIVGVQFNYRLSTLGFLAIPGTDIKGNFGVGDQVTALRWVRQNIASFGGDPNRVTIIGESAGAGSVRALLGSPPVIHEHLIAGGIAQSVYKAMAVLTKGVLSKRAGSVRTSCFALIHYDWDCATEIGKFNVSVGDDTILFRRPSSPASV